MNNLKIKDGPTSVVTLYVAGPLESIKNECARFCFEVGLCVNVQETEFIYTGGRETGVAILLLNYPRFPCDPPAMMGLAEELAKRLIESVAQHSALIVGPSITRWMTRREHT